MSALRYLLCQVNVLWHIYEDHGVGIPQAEDLRFNTDWTTEHIYAQAADSSLALNAHLWFNDRRFSRIHCLGNLLPLHPSLQQRASNEAFCVKRETYEISSNVLSRAASRLAGFQAGLLNEDQRASFEREVTYLPMRFLQRHARLKTLIARHIFGRDGELAGIDGFPNPPPPDAPPRAPPEPGFPAQPLDREGEPPRQLQRLNPPPPQLPPHLLRAISCRLAYDTALSWIQNVNERQRVRIAIDNLATEALAAVAPNDPRVRRYLQMAGDILDRNNTRFIIHSRRINIVSRFVSGLVHLDELEVRNH